MKITSRDKIIFSLKGWNFRKYLVTRLVKPRNYTPKAKKLRKIKAK